MSNRRLAVLLLLSVCVLAIIVVVALTWTPHQALARTHCHSVNGLPDPSCTPGVVDPRVTQDNLSTTICTRGYTKTVRPPASYSHDLKVRQIAEYGYADTNLASYEEDHLISLELGGHPTDPKNLWPEPRSGDHPAAMKDTVENSLHARVCAGTMTLAAAQAAIATNWASVDPAS